MVMLGPDGAVVLSPSDLTAAAECELGWLHRVDVKLGRASALAQADQLLDRLGVLGEAHEARELERLRRTHEVVTIARPAPYTVQSLRTAAERTYAALRDGAEVITQAVLFDGTFGGMADFLVRDQSGRYQVWDAKLARQARVSALLQVAAYADQLDALGIPRSDDGYLLLGDQRRYAHALDELIPVFRRRRDYLVGLVRAHIAQPDAVAWGDDRYLICGSCAVCEAGKAESDDVLLVAGLSRAQRAHLRAAGISTMTELASSSAPVDGVPERTWRALRAQASLQSARHDAVTFEVFDPARLALLPEPNDGDIFFDFEGDPLWTDSDGVSAGLEYLFGMVDLDEPDGRFTAYWAHDRAAERQALIDFLDHVERRRSEHPGMHIYHYAPYEPAALKRLTARHAVGEDTLDDLLRAGVFVDLYAAVRRSVRVSAGSYSIKQLEPIYMGDQLRDAEGVTTAGDSIVQYHQFAAARVAGDDARADELLESIADYNRYDCVSTWKLRDWLMTHRGDTPPIDTDGRAPEPTRLAELQAVADQVLRLVPAEPAKRNAEQHGMALLAAALGYFRREDKPMWWAHFARGTDPVDEWLDMRNTLIADHVEVVDGWHKATPKAITFARRLRLVGELDPGTSLRAGSGSCLVYEDIPDGETPVAGGHRALRTSATILSITLDETGNSVVDLVEKTKKGQDQFEQLPMAVFAHTRIESKSLESAIGRLVEATLSEGGLPRTPVCDVLARRAPRMGASTFDASRFDDPLSVDGLVAALRELDASYLAVQGPPGAGKTYLGSHAVAQLVADGWKVGVVAQSHATVEHFLNKLLEIGVDADRIAKKAPSGDKRPRAWTDLPDNKNAPEFLSADGGRVLGGTAWTFAPLEDGVLDLLVIDEAGQFSLAHTIAAAAPAQRLLLLGDPQQLPQVSQGSHPEPVHTSALGWLAEGHDTLPDERGFFLARSWRMHSALTEPVSALAYEGRLRSQSDVTDTRRLHGIEPGLHVVPVRHVGNAVVSAEEAAAVLELVRSLVGRDWKPETTAPERALQADDIIVVAAYNAQVALIERALADAGFHGTTVGTVDKIQGQEAAVAIVSMAASSAADIPRGLEFLLDRRRLNVAISRGQWATYLVHSPALGDTLPTNVAGLRQLGGFLRLIDR